MYQIRYHPFSILYTVRKKIRIFNPQKLAFYFKTSSYFRFLMIHFFRITRRVQAFLPNYCSMATWKKSGGENIFECRVFNCCTFFVNLRSFS